MPKTFTFQEEGLAYTVTLTQVGTTVSAEITVTEGAMDVNAIYFGDDDFSNESVGLSGPQNMNGARMGNETVQWDGAIPLSSPGLGPEGEDKATFVSADGDDNTFTTELTGVSSIDDISVLGVRATSTTTDSGSIKAVSQEDEPEEPPEDEAVFDKVGFGVEVSDTGGIENGVFVQQDDLGTDADGNPVEGTFANYASFYQGEYGTDGAADDYAIPNVETIVFYEVTSGTDETGNPIDIPEELFRIDAPDEGFSDAEEMIAAYDAAIEDGALEDYVPEDGASLMAAFALPTEPEDDGLVEVADEEEDEMEFA